MIEDLTVAFERCRELLRSQRAPLVTAIAEAQAAEAQAAALLKKLDESLATLDDEGRPRAAKKKRPAAEGQKKCADKPEVRRLIAACRADLPRATDDELKQAVASRLRDDGRSLSMFAKLFADCLAEDANDSPSRATHTMARPLSPVTLTRQGTL